MSKKARTKEKKRHTRLRLRQELDEADLSWALKVACGPNTFYAGDKRAGFKGLREFWRDCQDGPFLSVMCQKLNALPFLNPPAVYGLRADYYWSAYNSFEGPHVEKIAAGHKSEQELDIRIARLLRKDLTFRELRVIVRAHARLTKMREKPEVYRPRRKRQVESATCDSCGGSNN